MNDFDIQSYTNEDEEDIVVDPKKRRTSTSTNNNDQAPMELNVKSNSSWNLSNSGIEDISNDNDNALTPSCSQSACSYLSAASIHKPTQKSERHRTPSRTRTILTNFLDSVSTEQKQRIDNYIGRFFVGCNIPFSIIDSSFFKEMVRELRPAYSPPCSKTLSTSILDKIYENVLTEDGRKLSAESVMLIDGWKNSANNTKQVVTIIHSSDGDNAFIDAVDLTGVPETGEELHEICNNSITIAKEKYNVDLYAVVSDNASNMKKMGRLSTNLIHTTCNSHTGNLLAKDVIDKEIATKVTSILKEFKNCNLEKLILDNNGTKIKLPIDTRWCTYRDSFQSLIKNLTVLKKIVAEGYRVKDEIAQALFDNNFIENVLSMIEIQNPICTLINECQDINCNIADAANKWITLEVPDQFQHFLKKRRDMSLNVYTLTANYLHPVYRGELLSEEQKDEVDSYLIGLLDKDGLTSLHEFKTNSGLFGDLKEKHVTTPATFWGLTERKHPQLSKLALRLLKIPASSAQLERVFSSWSFVHSDLRNRLGSDKSKKLLHCYYSMRLRLKNQGTD